MSITGVLQAYYRHKTKAKQEVDRRETVGKYKGDSVLAWDDSDFNWGDSDLLWDDWDSDIKWNDFDLVFDALDSGIKWGETQMDYQDPIKEWNAHTEEIKQKAFDDWEHIRMDKL